MITHGTKTSNVFSTGKNPKVEIIRGYYLVLPNGDRHWMGESVYDAARGINKLCDKYLSDVIGWDYWIDFCSGYDIMGNLHWANWDRSDDVEAAGERMGW